MQVLGLITARGGSKGIPRKNLAPLCGRPLLAYTCDAARASRRLDRVVLTTDDPEIAEVGRGCGVEAPFLRPVELASDTASSVDVALHAVGWLEREQSWTADVVVILQPTSPLRTGRHIDEALGLLEQSGADTVVSVIEVPHNFSPHKLMRLENDRLVGIRESEAGAMPSRRQDVPRLYARNGPAVLAVRVAGLRQRRAFYGGRVAPLFMSPADSVDIDGPFDLHIAEMLLREGRDLRREATKP